MPHHVDSAVSNGFSSTNSNLLNLLIVYYQNVRGLKSKTSTFFLNSTASNFDIIALSETWLNPNIMDNELFDSSYDVYRCDRSQLTSDKKDGGGVLIAVKSVFPSERLYIDFSDHVELVIVKIKIQCIYLFVCCLYIPSNSSCDTYVKYMNALKLFFSCTKFGINDILLILGDFNLPHIDWISDSDSICLLPTNVTTSIEIGLLDILLSEGLSQINCIRNCMSRCLDLAMCNVSDNLFVCGSEFELSIVDKYHLPFEIHFSLDYSNVSECSQKKNWILVKQTTMV